MHLCDRSASSLEIAFVDAALNGLDVRLRGLKPEVEVIVLDPMRDGMQQIADTLADRVGVDAVHILSHGAQGCLILGNTIVDAASMAGKHRAALETIGDAVWPGG